MWPTTGLLLMLLPLPAWSQKASVTLGWTYEDDNQGNGFANLNGWYGSAAYSVASKLAVTFEHESYWGGFQGISTNQHVWLGGVTWKLATSEHRVIPFLQPVVGDTRSSYAGSIQNNFTFQLAGGVDIKLKGPFSLELVPAEYILVDQAGTPASSYSAAAGLQFSFGK